MLRSAWRALTTRGRLFLLAGLVVLTAALVWGQRDLARLGILFVLLPLASLFVISRVRPGVSARREVSTTWISLGQRTEVSLDLQRQGVTPVALLRFEDTVPRQLGVSPRFSSQRVTGSWRRRVRFPVMGLARGRYAVGPLTAYAYDPFGLARATTNLAGTTEMVVTPVVRPLSAAEGIIGVGAGGEATPQHIGRLGPDDVLVREYQAGDDVRRVHWRSTARWNQLMVRREEQALEPAAAVLLDNRASRHAGTGRESSFEWAVSAAASICSHLALGGYRVSLFDAADQLLRPRQADSEAVRAASLLALTEEGTTTNSSMAAGLRTVATEGGGDVVIAVLAGLSPSDVEELSRVRRSRAQGLALILDTASFAEPGTPASTVTRATTERCADQLRRLRWRVEIVQRGTGVDTAWRRFSERAER